MTSKGQVTIPVTVRYALGIGPGDEVVFAVENGHGVFRRAAGLARCAGILAVSPRDGAGPLERFLCTGDDAFAHLLESGSRTGVADVVVLDLLRWAADRVPRDRLVECLHEVCAERSLRLAHARAVRAAVDAYAAGADPRVAYAAARSL